MSLQPDLPDLRKTKAEAKSEFGAVLGVQGFGIGDGTLRIYIRNGDVARALPSTFHGVPVDFVITGDIAAQA